MPTIPAGTPPNDLGPHQLRPAAESFGGDAERYDRTRPPYPAALVARLIEAAGGPDFLDVGTGTGIAARQLRAAGARVLGVEPDPRMADFARRTGVEVEVATFETWEPAGRLFDAVVAATAWHWVDPVAGAAQAARVLRPGGLLAPFWHAFQPPAELAEAFATGLQRAVPDSPFAARAAVPAQAANDPLITRVIDGVRAAGGFDEPQQWRFEWERRYTRAEWLDQLPTSGALTRLSADQLAEVLAGAGAAVDALGGAFTMSYTTVAVVAARRGD